MRHQLTVLERQLGYQRPQFKRPERTLLAALLHPLPGDVPVSAAAERATRHHASAAVPVEYSATGFDLCVRLIR